MSLKPYPEYRDSGVDWIGAIPESWEVHRVSDLVGMINGFPFDSSKFGPDGTPLLRIRDLNKGESETCFEGDAPAGAIVDGEDVLVGMDGDFNVGRWLGEGDALLNQRMVALRGDSLTLNLLEYALPAPLIRINDLTYATTVKHLSSGQVRAIRITLPADDGERRSLSAFLNRETAEIDAFIADQEELIALLTERRAAAALHATLGRDDAVNRGLLGRFFTKIDRPAIIPGDVVTAFRDGAVTARSNRREDGFTFSASEIGYQGVAVGDFVFHGLDGFSGATGVSDSAGNCSPVYHVCAVHEGIDAEYAALYLRALGSSGFLGAYAWSVRQRAVDYRNWGVFSKLPLAFPRLEQQQETIRQFQVAVREIDAAIADAREAIALSKERRAALISAAVTGKIDVRNHGGVE